MASDKFGGFCKNDNCEGQIVLTDSCNKNARVRKGISAKKLFVNYALDVK